ncbi:hypothetical protein FHR38_001429 [Micromonospora polyrhachis]|uniref:Uncharacterized protein n=1 Tax=Micromonospora polyrhachis TaxID=1282883 RepID=A0A7W7SN59_9ACTN|nr:hypothetical protein [Micromonospora polyrhachis]
MRDVTVLVLVRGGENGGTADGLTTDHDAICG